jgi:hypothetical protein
MKAIAFLKTFGGSLPDYAWNGIRADNHVIGGMGRTLDEGV